LNAIRRPLRRAGHGTAADGSTVTWSMAEGRRGSRWREVRIVDGGIVSSLLLELDPAGRFAHLELSTAAGLITLHPEGDGTLHGNAISSDGIRHIVAVPWQPDDLLLVEGSTIARTAAARHGSATSGVLVGLDLGVDRRAIGLDERIVELDADGLPALADAETWPMDLRD
jgi:hypothetical protein